MPQDIDPFAYDMDSVEPSFLGRDHFLAARDEFPHLPAAVAWHSYALLVTRSAYPLDTRKPDFTSMGLQVVERSDTDLGPIAEFAKHGEKYQDLTKLDELAVGTASLTSVMRRIRSGEIIRPRGMGEGTVEFLHSLLGLLVNHPEDPKGKYFFELFEPKS